MATWFEFRAAEGEIKYVQQAFGEAFRLIDRLEELLSRYRETSEVCAIGQLAPGESLVLHADTFRCLELALEMAELTGGAFDPALGAAVDRQRSGSLDTELPVRGRLLLDPSGRSVTCDAAPVSLDLGAIGKGFALDLAAELLAEWDLGPCLLVGGGSSILAVGNASGNAGEAVTAASRSAAHPWEVTLTSDSSVRLMRGSVGCSGLAVKGSHILDPRTGTPAQTPARAWALAANAAVSDALSTAFMVLSRDEIAALCDQRPEVGAILQPDAASEELVRFGKALGVTHQFVRSTQAPSLNPAAVRRT